MKGQTLSLACLVQGIDFNIGEMPVVILLNKVLENCSNVDWNGGRLILIDPRNTSRECPECRYVDGANRKSQSEFACIQCCYQANADLVASRNILRAGLAQFACCFA